MRDILRVTRPSLLLLRHASAWSFVALPLALASCGGGPGESIATTSAATTVNSGVGPGYCSAHGGYELGTSYANVYTCGPDGTFQCVEYVARYFHNVFGLPAQGSGWAIDYGKNAASILHGKYPQFGLGTPGPGQLPAPGDILSLWGPATSDSAGHTAVVAAVNVNAGGTGTITIYDENDGNDHGKSSVQVSGWRLSFGSPPGSKYYYDQFNWLELTAPASAPPALVTLIGDFDGDGKSDVVLRGHPGWDTTPVFFSEGSGTFRYTNALDPAASIFNYTGALSYIGDFDGDGKSDVILGGVVGWDTTPVYFSNGDGSFRFTNAADPAGSVFNARPASGVTSVATFVGDFDGDGKTDAVVKGGPAWDTTPVYLSNGDGSFRFVHAPDPSGGIFNYGGGETLMGDFDGDGKADLLMKNGPGWDTTPVFFSKGDGTFRYTNARDASGGIFNYAGDQSFVGDFDGDGKADILVRGHAGWDTTPVFFSNGDGTFRFSNALDPSVSIFNYTGAETFIGDFNGDGKADVLLRASGWDTTPLFLSNGDGTFQFVNNLDAARTIFNDLGASAFLGDFNGDRKLDVVLRGVSGWDTTPVFFSTGTAFTFHDALDPSGGIFNVP
jgi:hypothetical protein